MVLAWALFDPHGEQWEDHPERSPQEHDLMDQPLTAAPSANWQAELGERAERKRIARRMGGGERIARHAGGQLTIREQIECHP